MLMMCGMAAYLLVRLFVFVPIVAEVILLIIILVLKVTFHVVIELFVTEGLASEPVDGTGNQLLLDVLPELIIELQSLLKVRFDLLVLARRLLWRRKEVEERLSRDSLPDHAGLLGI